MKAYHQTPEDLVEVLSVALDRPIAFHPVFADITGSVIAGLLLSQAVYWTKRASCEGWFYKTITQWEEETRLSRHEQETARRTLRKFSFWQEERRGVPAKMYYRVDLASLYSELVNFKENRDVQSSLPESGNLDCRKAANKNDGKQQSGLPETGKHNKGFSETTTEITSKTTPPTPRHHIRTICRDHGGRDFVERLLSGTLFQNADPGRISQVAQKHHRTRKDLEITIYRLDQQYRQSNRRIDDPTALLVCALQDGAYLSDSQQPEAEPEAEAERQSGSEQNNAEKKRLTEEAEDSIYKAADDMLAALPRKEYDEIMKRAKDKLPFVLRDSKKAIRGRAREMIMSRAMLPADNQEPDEKKPIITQQGNKQQ